MTLADGWLANDSAEGTEGRVLVFDFKDSWEGRVHDEQEVPVYFKRVGAEDRPGDRESSVRREFSQARGLHVKTEYDQQRDLLYLWFQEPGARAARTDTLA